jgi:hypothetical protein
MAFDPVSAALDLGGKLVDKLFPDPQKKAEALLKLEELRQSGDLAIIGGQMDINKIEAANPQPFVSGWRPFIGWVSGSALAMQLIVGPLVEWIANLSGNPVAFPKMDTQLLTTMLISMLGISGLRTYEKVQGVASK